MPTRSPFSIPSGEEGFRELRRLLPELPIRRPVLLGAYHQSLALPEPLDRPPQVLPDGLSEKRNPARTVGVGRHLLLANTKATALTAIPRRVGVHIP